VKAFIDIVVPATTFALLVAVGMDVTSEDFSRVRRQWGLVLVGLLAPPLLLPLLAFGLLALVETPPDVAAGVLLVAACPIGSISNGYSYMARASTALSVTLTGLSCALAVATIPLAGAAFGVVLGQPFGLQAPPGLLATQLLLVLGLPVAIGMLVRWRSASLAGRYAPGLQRGAYLGVAVLLVLIVMEDPLAFGSSLRTGLPLAAAFVAGSTALGWLTAAACTSDRRDRFTIAAEFGARNVGIATAIAVTFLGRVEFARFAATYALTEIPILLAAVALFRRSAPPGP
jgi:BASS family bile acid:Na+ symporter